jgi:ubiquinone/menaquinone biosynthesis C-methylase UbiE
MVVEITHKDVASLQAEYDKLYQEAPIRDEDRAYAWIARQVFKAQPKASSILDVACGGGYFLREMARLYTEATTFQGIDISGEALKIARQEFPKATYALSVAEAMPFEQKSFDVVTCLGSLEHFLNIGQALAEIRRILKPQGIFLAMVPNIMWYQDILSVLLTKNRKSRNQTHELFASHGEWKEMLESSGFSVVKTLKYNGIARSGWKQRLKNILIPERFSYHFIFIAKQRD